jgi:predicted site-specific integrase-resolvase
MKLSIKQASEILKINKKNIYNWIKKNKIKSELKNNKIVIDELEIEKIKKQGNYGNS